MSSSDFLKWDHVVALAGNPNTGKSTVFNALTGLRQHTGNWPGKTVTRAEGMFSHGQKRYKIIDLPGTYSLLSASVDEEITRNYLLFGRPDCVIVVVDATCLERNLNLALQVLEITDKAVICLNLFDEAKRKGIMIDPQRLSRDLGVPVVPTAAKTRRGMRELLNALEGVVQGRIVSAPYRFQRSGPVKTCLAEIAERIRNLYPDLPNLDWIAMRVLEGDQRIKDALISGEISSLGRGVL